jgi:hypothetical protein
MPGKPAELAPILHPDGTLGCVLAEKTDLGSAGILLEFLTPAPGPAPLAGRYFLARCILDTWEDRIADWSIYARRPLFAAGPPGGVARIVLQLPRCDDPGYAWLRRQALGTRINLIGPLGQTTDLPTAVRTLLVISTDERMPLMLPFIHAELDQGGRVTLYLRGAETTSAAARQLLPLAVEVHQLPDPAQWDAELQTALRWADRVVAALDLDHYHVLAAAIKRARFRLEAGFAHVLAAPDLICGYGACLACAVPTAGGGYTRACIHGPMFPLEELVR